MSLSAPVLALLEGEPRNWRMLNQWAKDARFSKHLLRQVLAWLEQRGDASTFTQIEGVRTTVYWASAAWREQQSGPPRSRT